jgi:glycosyltransferase involved in cell wall biosynthesis
MRVLVIAEYYPRAQDPTSGIWSHRQALAARDAGAELRVLVLHRPLPPLAAVRAGDLATVRAAVRPPAGLELDGLPVQYLSYLSPPRPWSYAHWGAWASPVLRRALARVGRSFPFELIHAHYAVPAGDAVRRAAPEMPLVVSVHGGDVHGPHASSAAVRNTLQHARLVLANSAGTARRAVQYGAHADATRVVHLGTDVPALAAATAWPAAASGAPGATRDAPRGPTLVTVGNLVTRKRHADVLAALPELRARHPGIRYVIVGDGPERESLRAQAHSLGVQDIVELRGRLAPAAAVAVARSATLFVLPSVAEAFGVAYIEAMAAGVPAVGCRGEDGPEEIAACGRGITLVAPCDPRGLAATLSALLADPERLAEEGRAARAVVEREFTWTRCGQRTVKAYADALAR